MAEGMAIFMNLRGAISYGGASVIRDHSRIKMPLGLVMQVTPPEKIFNSCTVLH